MDIQQCRICLAADDEDPVTQLIKPCNCNSAVHVDCLAHWIQVQPEANNAMVCEVCLSPYRHLANNYATHVTARVLALAGSFVVVCMSAWLVSAILWELSTCLVLLACFASRAHMFWTLDRSGIPIRRHRPVYRYFVALDTAVRCVAKPVLGVVSLFVRAVLPDLSVTLAAAITYSAIVGFLYFHLRVGVGTYDWLLGKRC